MFYGELAIQFVFHSSAFLSSDSESRKGHGALATDRAASLAQNALLEPMRIQRLVATAADNQRTTRMLYNNDPEH